MAIPRTSAPWQRALSNTYFDGGVSEHFGRQQAACRVVKGSLFALACSRA
jgi:hypothetical protein